MMRCPGDTAVSYLSQPEEMISDVLIFRLTKGSLNFDYTKMPYL